MRSRWWLCLAMLLSGSSASAQHDYRNTHAGRSLRVEDGVPEEPGSLEFGLPDARFDRLDYGVSRWRFEPSLSLGAPRQTTIELSTSFVWLEPGSTPRGGLTGFDVAVNHALARETGRMPAIATTVDVFLPEGAAATGGIWVQARAMATRSLGTWRVHANASAGSYRVDILNPAVVCSTSSILIKLGYSCDGSSTPVPGGPCADIDPVPGGTMAAVFAHCARADPAFFSDTTIRIGPRTLARDGSRWFGGLGIDRDLVRLSTLVQAEVFASQLNGLQARPDWGAGIGLRHQLGPRAVLSLGLGRKFSGAALGWSGTGGVTWSIPVHGAR